MPRHEVHLYHFSAWSMAACSRREQVLFPALRWLMKPLYRLQLCVDRTNLCFCLWFSLSREILTASVGQRGSDTHHCPCSALHGANSAFVKCCSGVSEFTVLDIKLKEKPGFQQRNKVSQNLTIYRFNSSSHIHLLPHFWIYLSLDAESIFSKIAPRHFCGHPSQFRSHCRIVAPSTYMPKGMWVLSIPEKSVFPSKETIGNNSSVSYQQYFQS